MREKCEREAWPLDALSVGPTHVHALVHLPKPALRESSSEGRDDASAYEQAKHIAGRLKQAASHAVREHLPGKIWSQGGVPKRIRDATHLSEARRYIHDHRKQRCLVWVADHVHIPER